MAVCLEYQDVYGTITTDTPGWNAGARSNLEFTSDGVFGWEVARSAVGIVCGFNSEDTSQHHGEIEHGFYFTRGTYDIIEAGTQLGIGPVPYVDGTRFYIARIGTDALYMIRPSTAVTADYYTDSRYPGFQLPGGVLWVSTQPSFGTIFLDTSFYNVGDRLFCEWGGAVWFPGVEDTPLGPNAGSAELGLPFTVEAADVGTFALVTLPFEVSATGVTGEGATLDMPFTVLGADTVLNSLIIAELPYEVEAEGSGPGGSIYPGVAGITGFLTFEVSASGSENNVTIQAELPFVVTAFGSSAGHPLENGAVLELPFDVFGTTSHGGQPSVNNGAILQLPFDLFSTGSSPTDDVIDAGAFLEVPFTLAATGSDDDDLSPESWVFAEIPFTVAAIGNESEGNFFNIMLSFNPLGEEPGPEPGEGVEITENITISMQAVAQYVVMMRDFLTIVPSIQTFRQVTVEVAETALAVAEAIPQFSLFLQETFNITDNLTIQQVVELADTLVAASMVQNVYQGVVAVLSAMLADDNRITGGSADGATAGVGVSDFGPPTVVFNFTGYWPAGTVIQLGYTTDAGNGFISYTLEYPQNDAGIVMALFAAALDEQPLVNATYDGTNVTITAQAPATTVNL